MSATEQSGGFRLPILQGLLPIKASQIPAELIAGLTLAALANNADPALRWLCLDASAIDDVDYSAAETLRSLFATLREKGIRLVVAQVLDDVHERSRYRLRELFGEDAFYDSLDDVVRAYREQAGAAVPNASGTHAGE